LLFYGAVTDRRPTAAARAAPVAGRHLTLPPWAERAGDLVFPAAIAAVLGLTVHGAVATGTPAGLFALAGGAAVTFLLTRRGRSVLTAMGAGLATVVAVNALAALAGS
jgi:hypothetical protein